MRTVFWFRNDLRVHDNPGLAAASVAAQQAGVPLEAVYVATPQTWQRHDLGPRRADLLLRRVNALGGELAARGIVLHCLTVPRFCDLASALVQWLGQAPVALYANRELPLDEVRRDEAVCARLGAQGIACHWYDERCVLPPGQVLTGAGDMFKVFTPFSRAWLKQVLANGVRVAPLPAAQGTPLAWSDWACDYPRLPSDAWPVAEQAVRQQLWDFARYQAVAYAENRDLPAVAATSRLSPYLALGVISVRQCLLALIEALGQLPVDKASPGFAWLNELIWREFYQHLLALEPRLSRGEPFKPEMAALGWRHDDTQFALWCQGRTGYPIVDAAMRCLNQTGWMHNRLRMIVASFLTKDLQLPWWWGERYFMQQLIDGELAANNGGWQWSAGTGADAAPWFRIFNPTTQSQKFDPHGHFIRRYLPELADVPDSDIHAPQRWLQQRGRQSDYPAPMVEHAVARELTLAMFRALAD